MKTNQLAPSTMTADVKKIPAVSVIISENNDNLALTFANGKTLTLEVNKLADNIKSYALAHGIKQKLVDAAAISRDTETGKPASLDDKYNAVREVYDRLLSGMWNAIREGGNNAGGLLFKALCEIYPNKSREQIKSYLDGKSTAEKLALRSNPKIAPIIQRLSATASIDSDSLLDELK